MEMSVINSVLKIKVPNPKSPLNGFQLLVNSKSKIFFSLRMGREFHKRPPPIINNRVRLKRDKPIMV
jgi:hypothetical protein